MDDEMEFSDDTESGISVSVYPVEGYFSADGSSASQSSIASVDESEGFNDELLASELDESDNEADVEDEGHERILSFDIEFDFDETRGSKLKVTTTEIHYAGQQRTEDEIHSATGQFVRSFEPDTAVDDVKHLEPEAKTTDSPTKEATVVQQKLDFSTENTEPGTSQAAAVRRSSQAFSDEDMSTADIDSISQQVVKKRKTDL